MEKLIEQGVKPTVAAITNPIDRNLELGKKLGFNGTPTLILLTDLNSSERDLPKKFRQFGKS